MNRIWIIKYSAVAFFLVYLFSLPSLRAQSTTTEQASLSNSNPAVRIQAVRYAHSLLRTDTKYAAVIATAMEDSEQSVRLAAIDSADFAYGTNIINDALVNATASHDPVTQGAAVAKLVKLTTDNPADVPGFQNSKWKLQQSLGPMLYSSEMIRRENAGQLWKTLRLGEPPGPPIPVLAIVIACVLGGLVVLLAGVAWWGKIRGTVDYRIRPIVSGPVSQLRRLKTTSRASGIFIVLTGMIVEVSSLWDTVNYSRRFDIGDVMSLELFLMLNFLGLAILLWGISVANHQGRPLDVIVFYILAGCSDAGVLLLLVLTLFGLTASKTPLPISTLLLFEVIAMVLLTSAMAAARIASVKLRLGAGDNSGDPDLLCR